MPCARSMFDRYCKDAELNGKHRIDVKLSFLLYTAVLEKCHCYYFTECIRQTTTRHKQVNPLLTVKKQRVNNYLQKSGSLSQGMKLSSCSSVGNSPSFGNSVNR